MTLPNPLFALTRRFAAGGAPRFLPVMSCALLLTAALSSALHRTVGIVGDRSRSPDPTLSPGISPHYAQTLCQSLTGQPEQTVALTGNPAPFTQLAKAHFKWQVTCRSGADDYILCINATTGKLWSIHRELDALNRSAPRPQGVEGVAPIPLSEAAAIAQGKRYLILAGCVAPPEKIVLELARVVHWAGHPTEWRVCFAYRGEDGIRHRARLSLEVSDGSLIDLIGL